MRTSLPLAITLTITRFLNCQSLALERHPIKLDTRPFKITFGVAAFFSKLMVSPVVVSLRL